MIAADFVFRVCLIHTRARLLYEEPSLIFLLNSIMVVELQHLYARSASLYQVGASI
jgi:hypothetical protein